MKSVVFNDFYITQLRASLQISDNQRKRKASAPGRELSRADAIEKMRKTRADLLPHQLEHLVDGCRETITVLAASLGIVGLAAATTLDELGRLADDLARVELMAGHEIVGEQLARAAWLLVCAASRP